MSEKTWVKMENESGIKEKMKLMSRGKCVNPVSVEAFDIFSRGEISELV